MENHLLFTRSGIICRSAQKQVLFQEAEASGGARLFKWRGQPIGDLPKVWNSQSHATLRLDKGL